MPTRPDGIGLDGRIIAGPAAPDREEIVYGKIDLEAIVRPKLMHDVAGNYSRFDMLSLRLNRAPLAAITEMTAERTEGAASEMGSLLDVLRKRLDSASPEELRALIPSVLAVLEEGRGARPD